MKYKIVRKEYLYKEEVYERFYVMYESMAWWRKPKWKHCREFTYASYDDWIGEKVIRNTLAEAESYINSLFLQEKLELESEDVRIYETRESKLNKILSKKLAD